MNFTALLTSAAFTILASMPNTIPNQLPPQVSAYATSYVNQVTSAKTADSSAISCENSDPKKAYYIDSLPLSKQEQKIIYDTCLEYHVSYTLVLGILKTESNFNSSCISHNSNGTTDAGIAQINSAYQDTYAARAQIPPNEFDPLTFTHAIRALCGQIAYLNHYYAPRGYSAAKQTLYVLNSYNMGPTGYARFVKERHTLSRYYDKRVLANQELYNKSLNLE